MSTHDKLAGCGVSRRDMLRIGAGGGGFSVFGGIGPVPAVFGRASEATAASPAGARPNMIVNVSDSQSLAVKAENHVPLVFLDPTKFQRAAFAQERAALDLLDLQTAPLGAAHAYAVEVTRSAAQASEVVRLAWSKYKGKDNVDLRLLDLDKVAALIEADFPTKLYYVPLRNSLFDTHGNH